MWCEDTLSKAPKSNLCTRYIDCALVSQKKRQSIRKAMCWTIFLSNTKQKIGKYESFLSQKSTTLLDNRKKMKGKTPVHYSYRHVSHGGGTQLRGHIWPVVIRAFVASKAFVAIVCFLGQIIKYALRIILGFGSNGLWDWNQINFTYTLLSRSQLCRNYALFEGHFWPKFVDGGGTKTFQWTGGRTIQTQPLVEEKAREIFG